MSDVFKTLLDQINELKGMGLVIPDEEKAKDFLYHSQHQIGEYLDAVKVKGNFPAGFSFESIEDPYLCDREMRNRLLYNLETIENSLKSTYSYEFTKIHGEYGYLDPSFFTDSLKHKEILDKADKQRKKRAPHDRRFAYLDINGNPLDLPILLFMKLLTIKDITDLYIYTADRSIKKKVAYAMGLTFETRDAAFGRVMREVTYLRNLCAHGCRLYDFSMTLRPYLSSKERRLLAKRSDGSSDNSRLFGHILVMKKILPKQDFSEFRNSIVALARKYPMVKMEHYEFPLNWEKIL